METIFAEVSRRYGITLLSSERVQKGYLSENYIVSDQKQKYFLKQYRFTDEERVAQIHLVKQFFAKEGIPIILPMKSRNGETFFSLQGKYFALFPFVDGIQYDRGELPEIEVSSFGRMLGKLHRSGSHSNIVLTEQFSLWDRGTHLELNNQIMDLIEHKEDLDHFDISAKENLRLKKKLVLESKISYADLGFQSDHLLHGDYLDHNVFFNNLHEVSAVFDLEKACYGPRAYELWRSATYCFLEAVPTQIDITKLVTYITSYSHVYPISKEELVRGFELFFAKNIHSLWVESEHYLRGNTRVDEFLFTDIERLQYLATHREKMLDAVCAGVELSS